MKTLLEHEGMQDILSRLDNLHPSATRQWGKMEVAQMMAHCSATMDMASGRLNPPRVLIGRLIGWMFKPVFTNEKPFSRNSPTHDLVRVVDARDFSRERENLKANIRQFHEAGEAGCTRHPHPFFGALTPQEWGRGSYKHLDHHLRQFGA